jgi:hypothetical protein
MCDHGGEELGCFLRRDLERRFTDGQFELVDAWDDAGLELVKEPDALVLRQIERPLLERLPIAPDVQVEKGRLRRIGNDVDPGDLS